MNQNVGKSIKHTAFFSVILTLLSMLSFAQSRQKIDETWELLLLNNRGKARETFEKHLRKDIGKNIEILLLNAYLENEEGNLFVNEDFVKQFIAFEEAKYYLYPNWYDNHFIGDINNSGYNDYTFPKINVLAADKVLGNDLMVLYHKYLADKKTRKSEGNNFSKKVNAITDWQFCGVFENLNDSGLETAFEPETYAKNDKLFDAASNGKVGWYNPVDKQDSEGYHFFYNEQEYGAGVMYAQTFIESTVDQRVYLNLGASYSVKLFLNDVEVYRNNQISFSDLNAYRIALNLKKGTNRLLIKASTGKNNDYFFMSVTDENYHGIDGLTFHNQFKSYEKGNLSEIKPEVVAPFFETYFTERLEQQPENSFYTINLFKAYLNNGKYDQAEKALKKLYQKYPNSSMLRVLMATLYSKKGESQQSKELYENIAATDKDYYLNTIRMLSDNDVMSTKTITELEKIRDQALEANHLYVHYLVDFYIASRIMDKEKALTSYQSLVAATANTEMIQNAYGYVLFNITNDREKTIAFLEKRYKENINEEVISELIKHYNLSGKKTEKVKLLEEQSKRYPYFYHATKDYVNYLNEEKEYQKVIELTEKGLQNFPYSFTLMEEQGKAYNNLKNTKKAEELFKKSLSHHTGNTALRKRLYDITNRKDESEEIVTADLYDYIAKNRQSSMKTDYGVIILLDECIVNVFPEGGQKYDFTYIYEITSDTGVEHLKEYKLDGYGTTVLKSEIIKPDGSIVPAERSYGNLVFTNLKPGDVVLVKYQGVENAVGRFFKDITLNYPFRTYYPIELSRYGIIYPKDKTFKSKLVNGNIKENTQTVGDKKYTEWRAEKVEAVAIYEDYAPSLSDAIETLHISSIDSWADIANWYADLVQKNLEMDKVTTDAFHQIFPNGVAKLSEEEKAQKIYAYIQDNITYSFLDFRQSGYVPQKPSKTITTKLGDCKDLSALFVTLANHAGLNSELVLVLTNDNGRKINPLPNIGFNHCIVKVDFNGKEHFMELTDNYAPFNTMPTSLYQANALVVSFDRQKNTNSTLIAIPFNNTTTSKVKQYTTIDLTQDLKKTKNTIVLDGSAKSYYNNLFSPSTSEDIRSTELEKIYNYRLNKTVKINKVQLNENDKYGQSLSFSVDFDINDRLQKIGKLRFTTLPSIVQPYTRDVVALEQRKFPIFYPVYEDANSYYSETIVNIDKESTFKEIPENQKFSYKEHKYEIRYELVNNQSLKVVREVYIPFDDIAVNDYPQFKNYVEKIIEQEESVIAFD